MSKSAAERAFQSEIVKHLTGTGWLEGKSAHYDRERALYPEDVIGFVKETQPEAWEKLSKQYPKDPEKALLDAVARQLGKADPNGTAKELRKYGTLGVLRHPIKDRGAQIRMCQFKPDHDLNPETLMRYGANRLRVVQELKYSPYSATYAKGGATGKDWRIDLVLFVNGIPVATLELKSEFKQAIEKAVSQYKKDRPPKDPHTGKNEPLLTFKRGALVHFAVSQFEVQMCTKLAGKDSYFLPFNKGTAEGAAGNDVPEDGDHCTSYLWKEVLQWENFLNILARFIHLEVREVADFEGLKSKKETLIFPRFHQWDVVNKLIDSARTGGPGQKYLVQHSAGSGKSNSIAWTAHQLSSLHKEDGTKVFQSVLVITDRTVLDDQLQDTIYQFEHSEGVVGRINREEGGGSKSSKLAGALLEGQPIIIVTIQTFPFVLEEIRKNTSLKESCFAIIADEAHSSQSGSTARKLREVLMADQLEEGEDEEGVSAEDMLDLALEARRASDNLSYFAFTATPKPRTLELFGRLPDPGLPAAKDNRPEAFHVYSMRQAIEEGFILDVLTNYTTYSTAYKLAQKQAAADEDVDSKKASKQLKQWVKLHGYNVGQRVQVIVEHFRRKVQDQLGGQAKAMVVTSSRIEAARYKLGFDRYIKDQGYSDLQAMVAFSGEVNDPESADLPLTEKNMNPNLKGRDMRKAFDTGEYQVMIVANKFQTGFDQPKLCAMYVLKKLHGVDCVQTLSRLNRTFPGKESDQTFVLDFINDPQDILEAFLPYYQTAELADVSDPNLVYSLFDKLGAQDIYTWSEVEYFTEVFFSSRKGEHAKKALSSACKPAVDRWKSRYKTAVAKLKLARKLVERAKKAADAVLIANAEKDQKEAKDSKDKLDIFKKDLGSFTRFYEFMSQIVDYDDRELEKLNVFARHLAPLLREDADEEDPIDLSNVALTHYRLQKKWKNSIVLSEGDEDSTLKPGSDLGSGTSRDKEEARLSAIIARMNELFAAENLSDSDLVNYAHTIADKVRENELVMSQVKNNTGEQTLLGDFPKAVIDAVLASSDAHNEIKTQYLSDATVKRGFEKLILELLAKAG
ncbi:type I restriction endonuclease [Verrucomicrobiales bacterium BCK34]|nr:type I restriction endonuclease [Verrucomicrobiales bacterium BCK34]